jgi:hypothetical protein
MDTDITPLWLGTPASAWVQLGDPGWEERGREGREGVGGEAAVFCKRVP